MAAEKKKKFIKAVAAKGPEAKREGMNLGKRKPAGHMMKSMYGKKEK